MPTRVDAFTSEYPGRSSVLANEVYICEAFKPQSTSVRMPKNAKNLQLFGILAQLVRLSLKRWLMIVV
jgi:hypothetical protein